MKTNPILRGVFWAAYYLFARHLPRSGVFYSLGSRNIRAFICRRLFSQFGRNVNIECKTIFYDMSNSKIGDHSGIGMHSIVGRIDIGDNVMIGPQLIAISRNHKFQRLDIPMIYQDKQEDRQIVIEDDVWIGARVIILPGIRIGRGSIIGAGAVVTKNVAPYDIVAGNPAKTIENRKMSAGVVQKAGSK